MAKELRTINYIDYKVYNVTNIKNKYGFRVILTLDNNSKRSIQHSGFIKKDIAEKERYKVIADLETRKYIVYSNVTLKEYMEYWFEYIVPHRLKSEQSIDAYKNCIFNHIIPNIGNLKLTELKQGHIKKFYEKEYNYSPSVSKLTQTVLSVALDDAVVKFFIPQNIAKGIKINNKDIQRKTKEEQKEEFSNNYHTLKIDAKKTYTIEEIIRMIKASKETPIYLNVLFAVLMGLRKSEINGVKYSDIDYINRKLYVQRQLGKKYASKKEDVPLKTFTKQEIPLKTNSSYRVLDIPDLVFEAILEERKKYEARRNRRKNDKSNPFQDLNYICCSSSGRPRCKTYVFKHFKKLKEENNLPDLPFHKLRTTYTTILAKNDFSMKAISKQLGHSSEMITFENYTDKNEIIQDCLEELEPFIEKVIANDEIKMIDCTDTYTNEIMDEYIKNILN